MNQSKAEYRLTTITNTSRHGKQQVAIGFALQRCKRDVRRAVSDDGSVVFAIAMIDVGGSSFDQRSRGAVWIRIPKR